MNTAIVTIPEPNPITVEKLINMLKQCPATTEVVFEVRESCKDYTTDNMEDLTFDLWPPDKNRQTFHLHIYIR